MLFGGIAFVFFPIVHRELFMDTCHVFITVGFGQNGCGRNAHILAVSFYYALVFDFRIGLKTIAIHDQEFWLWA